MDDRLSPVDQDLASRIKALAVHATYPRDLVIVVDKAFAPPTAGWRGRQRWLRPPAVAVAAVLVLAVSVGTVGLLTKQFESSQLASARVNGLDYTVAAARSFDAPMDALTRYAETTIVDQGFAFDGLAAYSIRGVDPSQILVMKLAPDQRDDAGPLGSYILLVRGPDAFALICAYFDPTSDATPRVCRTSG